MKMSDRSAFSALSFCIVVVGLTFYPGSAALALEQDHGNPGKFIENIRKGLSGLSKYFWSPNEQLPVEGTKQQATDDKPVGPVSKTPKADAPKADASTAPERTDGKSAAISPATVVKKQIVKPAQTIKPDRKAVRLDPIPQTKFESKAVIDRKKKLAAAENVGSLTNKTSSPVKPVAKENKPALKVSPTPKVKPTPKAPGLSQKAHAQPESQSKAIAQAQKKRAIPSTREKVSSLVIPGQIPQKNAPSKLSKNSIAKKPVATSTQSKKPVTKNSSAAAKAVNTAKPAQQQLVNNDKGTYIWVPNLGSQLSQRFGLTGIPAKGLAATGDLNRTDGRWIFAPKKPGQLPSIYGLSGEIHAAGDAGVWVGGGRNWVYVFDKGRNYGSIVGGTKTTNKVAAKPAQPAKPTKPVTSQKPSAQKSANSQNIKQHRNPQKIEHKKAATPQKGIEVKKSAKLAAKGPHKQAAAKPENKRMSQANTEPKTARNGKWSRVNNRWVYVPQAQPGQKVPSNGKGLAEQVAKAPVTGGWVQRNNRWVYVAPRQQGARAGAIGPNKNKKGAAGAVRSPKVNKSQGIVSKKAGLTPKAKEGAAKSDLANVQKPRVGKAPKMDARTGLAEGPAAKQPQATKNQKIWVRKDNRWVYVFATPADTTSAQDHQAAKTKDMRIAGHKLGSQNAANQGNKSQGDQKPLGEFMFFVPGRTPGTGNWFIAPLQMLEKARKVERGAFGAPR